MQYILAGRDIKHMRLKETAIEIFGIYKKLLNICVWDEVEVFIFHQNVSENWSIKLFRELYTWI
jgi:hypothetical protein